MLYLKMSESFCCFRIFPETHFFVQTLRRRISCSETSQNLRKSKSFERKVKFQKFDFPEGHNLCVKKLVKNADAKEPTSTRVTHLNQNFRFGKVVSEKSQKD